MGGVRWAGAGSSLPVFRAWAKKELVEAESWLFTRAGGQEAEKVSSPTLYRLRYAFTLLR